MRVSTKSSIHVAASLAAVLMASAGGAGAQQAMPEGAPGPKLGPESGPMQQQESGRRKCGPAADITGHFKMQGGAVGGEGLAGDKAVVTTYMSTEGDFALVSRDVNGRACILAEGQRWSMRGEVDYKFDTARLPKPEGQARSSRDAVLQTMLMTKKQCGPTEDVIETFQTKAGQVPVAGGIGFDDSYILVFDTPDGAKNAEGLPARDRWIATRTFATPGGGFVTCRIGGGEGWQNVEKPAWPVPGMDVGYRP